MILDRRIGRLGYLLGQVPVMVFIAALYQQNGWRSVQLAHAPATVVVPLVSILIWDLVLTAWRCHDYNQSLWSNFWTEHVPFVGPLLGFWDLLTTPGSPGFNSYGRPPAF